MRSQGRGCLCWDQKGLCVPAEPAPSLLVVPGGSLEPWPRAGFLLMQFHRRVSHAEA